MGYLLYHFGYDVDLAKRILHVVDLYVDPVYRLRGVGQALMESAREICAGVGGKRLFWSVYEPNHSAFRFYENLGARYTEDLKFMYLPVEDKSNENQLRSQ